MMKVIAFYLPQFHDIPENDEWWGKGFTEWTNVKKAIPLFEEHRQPRVPLNKNYYCLLDDDVKIWQARIAKEHGIYGFCYYHYWFCGKKLLEKPMEQMLVNPKIDIPFCVCWANDAWTKAWVGETKTIMEQRYGNEEDWKEHFEYLLPFFKDNRYIKEENKPLMVIYRPEAIACLNEMLDYWNRLAINEGFEGLVYAYQTSGLNAVPVECRNNKMFKYDIEFEPGHAKEAMNKKTTNILKKIKATISKGIDKIIHDNVIKYVGSGIKAGRGFSDYDKLWTQITTHIPDSDKCVPGAFVDWDNTPRLGDRGSVVLGACPEKFKHYFDLQIKRARELYKKDYLFVFAWNEWAEGGYLEPDEENGYAYLEAIKEVLIKNNEFEE